ncbi:MAG: sigma-54 dependent transcriptional regulator, partial [Desulfobacterales bacterium]|nr:sigma-54 dependent transcriptional regulator [Desulfobacterales bacterium]
LCFANGKGFDNILPILEKVRTIAEALGDRRSLSLIDMHRGLFLYLSNRFAEALKALSAGKQAVETLGDTDILNQAAAYIGLFFFIQGMYLKAIPYFETAVEQAQAARNDFINPFAPVFFSFAVLPFSQSNRAFTILDIFHRKAEQKELSGAATILRAVLGYVLLRHRKEKEALFHLTIARKLATEQGNTLALYWVNLFMTYHQFLSGNLMEARNLFISILNNVCKSHLAPPYSTFPWIMDMLLEFEQQNIAPIPTCNFDSATQLIKNGPSIPAKGWLMRILAKRLAMQKGPVDKIRSYLSKSMKYLEQTEYKIELAKTRIEIARQELSKGARDKAQEHAREAWRCLPAFAEHIFPDELQQLIANVSKGPFLKSFISPEIVLNQFAEIMEKVAPASDIKMLLSRTVMSTNWFFSAERGGLFLFEGDIEEIDKEKPQLIGAVNLTEIETASENFKPQLKLIKEAILKDSPLLNKISITNAPPPLSRMVAVLCLPFKLENGHRCALYHDNSALLDCFDFLNDNTLGLLKTYIETLFHRIYKYYLSTFKKKSRAIETIVDQGTPSEEIIIGQSAAFREVQKTARRIAKADFPILIQGETGVGKEVMARWVHKNSPRQNGPFVIIDATTIPENLIESELFGHEKGAFTGADRLKPGRVELAGDGTLFLDEVGELPLSIQAKLLRVLEEKTFTRVGGSRVHQCDFRLIAATNRNLAKEVQAGRFREDLFYRLNVLPLQIPPLRERKEDIVLFARHFLEISCKRLKRPSPPITPGDVSALLTYPWPGNIRELKNIIERVALLSSDNELALQLVAVTKHQSVQAFEDMPAMTELQRRYIAHVLAATGGRISGPGGAADILRMKRTTLYARMKKLGMPMHAEVTTKTALSSSHSRKSRRSDLPQQPTHLDE